MGKLSYVGSELELFSRALNWKAYWKSLVEPYVEGSVLDAGAGIGSTARLFRDYSRGSWTCMDPDEHFCAKLESARQSGDLGHVTRVINGTLADLTDGAVYDTILYIDVLEHIDDDAAEMRRASQKLVSGGHLIVLAPAHNFLFSPFDRAVGHFRRYSKNSAAQVTPPDCRIERLMYADSLGLFLSMINSRLLKSSMPTEAQIAFWDKAVVPVSRRFDPLIGHRAGKSVIGIWTKNP